MTNRCKLWRSFGLVSIIAGMVLATNAMPTRPEARAADPTPQQVFERRIMPIFKSPNPSSCTQCHLAGVDLKNYILPSSEKTFLSLRDQELIDLDKPMESKILRLIQMGEEDKKGAALIQQKVRKQEYEAFAEWIKACCSDDKLRDAPKLKDSDLDQPKRPLEVIRHGRSDHLLESFERNIWSVRFRCVHCHMEGERDNPKLTKQYGERVSWLKAEGAEATMKYLMASKDVDTKQPAKSLLLLKPLNEVKHGGGKKMNVGDADYVAFRNWLEDYAKIVNDKYAKAADLPPEMERAGTEIWLKLERTPAAWNNRVVLVTVHAKAEGKNSFEAAPIATTSFTIDAQKNFGNCFLVVQAAPDSARAQGWKGVKKPTLPADKYLVKVYLDSKEKLLADWNSAFKKATFAGQVEIDARWQEGYNNLTSIEAARLKR